MRLSDYNEVEKMIQNAIKAERKRILNMINKKVIHAHLSRMDPRDIFIELGDIFEQD